LEILDSPFFPLPRIIGQKRLPGYRFGWTSQCNHCDKQCESSGSSGLSVCSYGVNFQRISNDRLIFGFLIPNASGSAAQKKALRLNPQNRITPTELQHVQATIAAAQKSLADDIAQSKQQIIQEYKEKKGFQKDILELLKPEIEKNLAFLHDYKQFVSRVKQNINVVLQERYGNGDIDSMLARATQAEGAIYWASSLMTEKLQTAFLLLHPEKLLSPLKTATRLHSLVLKYVRIYNASFKEKGIKLDVVGESFGEIKADGSAIGVIPQTFLDNAFKYAPRGSTATVSFNEYDDFIVLGMTSFGPRIDQDEKEKIFDLFYRGRNAVREQEEGAGFGLHLAQFVAKSIGSEIVVHQNSLKTRFGYETRFSMRFPRER